MSEKPWRNPSDEDDLDWDEPLPEVIFLAPDYGAELPLWGERWGNSAGTSPDSPASCWTGLPPGSRNSMTTFTPGNPAGGPLAYGTAGPARQMIWPLPCAASSAHDQNSSWISGRSSDHPAVVEDVSGGGQLIQSGQRNHGRHGDHVTAAEPADLAFDAACSVAARAAGLASRTDQSRILWTPIRPF